MKRIGPNVTWKFRFIGYVILGILTLLLVLASCTYHPPTNYDRNRDRNTVSPYEKYKARELQREQLRYYRNQNSK